jgi:outer membrane protein
MKNLAKYFCAAIAILVACQTANAQSKVGYINFEKLVNLMPESASLSAQLETYRKSFNDQVNSIVADLEKKNNKLQENRSTMSDELRVESEQQILALNRQLQQLQSTAQQSVRAKLDELKAPILAKARAALTSAAAENGYTLVLNIGDAEVLVGSQSDDLLLATKAKLGIQ